MKYEETPTRELPDTRTAGMNGEKLEYISKHAGYRRIAEEVRKEAESLLEDIPDEDNTPFTVLEKQANPELRRYRTKEEIIEISRALFKKI